MLRNLSVNRHILLLIGVLAFAITLAILIANRLTGETAQAVGLGVAVGVIIGVGSALLVLRFGRGKATHQANVEGLLLTDEQAEALYALLDRRQASPESFPLTARRNREFAAVGGAELPDPEE